MHTPVLLNEAIEVLAPKAGEFFIDGTIDGGGHALAVLEKILPTGKLLGVDWDKELIEKAKKKFPKENTVLVNDNFKNLPLILKEKKLPLADGLFLDLGFSSWHLEKSGRGFSFNAVAGEEPLLMTYSLSQKSVCQWLKELSVKELAEVIKNFSQERYSERIAQAIKENLPQTTDELVQIIKAAVPKNYEHGRINPATRTFLALRIFANQELKNLQIFLSELKEIIKSGGRVAIVTFNSLEDRLVKNFFRQMVQKKEGNLLTKKFIKPTPAEIKINPRSRSAKLRALQIL
ncbi:16S rRNA (cytosine(1402)-N(4))-methyltransferase [Candidatus Jorgensenbacteria bacterium CG_4_10_14_0_8_um_filter_39_13]|uniref:Ribosomal RNA small subunit methyltransferase H n=2 Tax=Candidatus Joergenseniibacteriota TaxID=1752739 RepID=A0A2M7RHH9_9BACT|nr:MAG: 16S rRNA (cytosine(1402)-N(4))-methyltransferase [Candidatus Jorgensenbacteria bacterium CG11_big_fil_rev_8_21_14_0_20_38_23]PIV12946.1 MAG: 16S rRNA (cytosine(1402)-N(4))-methyltransferase [Candidatus Jorgensenbacteria bacterium CG03_land_8_20_14_0_80_38_39]PIW97775.1 MAG: 16S rRNA (cytosine(1402)-N(4))-methyltransferase [Candidatus Jorgensenbacteria bacterium CG_4_8_14_3_um_filter_38_10]PIY96198.1 MAG: 16S rRNA (cytosine(1402)-N(4))-methyltransferase [Candidatus Jorgensenbacteria bacte